MLILSVLLFAQLSARAGSTTPIDEPISVGSVVSGAVQIPLTVGGINYKTFWSTGEAETIRWEAFTKICPVFVQDGALGQISDCEQIIALVQRTLTFRKGWAGDYAMAYLDSVEMAVENEAHFEVFKSDKRYKNIVESLGPLRAAEFLKYAFSKSPELFYNDLFYERVRENDFIGSPQMLTYTLPAEEGATVRSNGNAIVRYIKVLSDLSIGFNLLEDASIKSIAEIGIGFGGQAQVLLSHPAISGGRNEEIKRPINYYFFDLPPVQQLAQKYLSKFPWLNDHNFHFMAPGWDELEQYRDNVYDLCISSYAFSELSTQIQDLYLKLVLKKCKRGYMLYNTIGQDSLGSYSVQQFLQLLQHQSLFTPINRVKTDFEFPDDVMNSTVLYWMGTI